MKCRQHEMETKLKWNCAIEVHCCAKRSLWLFTMGGESIWFNQCGFRKVTTTHIHGTLILRVKMWRTETSFQSKPPAAMNAILMSEPGPHFPLNIRNPSLSTIIKRTSTLMPNGKRLLLSHDWSSFYIWLSLKAESPRNVDGRNSAHCSVATV